MDRVWDPVGSVFCMTIFTLHISCFLSLYSHLILSLTFSFEPTLQPPASPQSAPESRQSLTPYCSATWALCCLLSLSAAMHCSFSIKFCSNWGKCYEAFGFVSFKGIGPENQMKILPTPVMFCLLNTKCSGECLTMSQWKWMWTVS